jgi:hypothetical protein
VPTVRQLLPVFNQDSVFERSRAVVLFRLGRIASLSGVAIIAWIVCFDGSTQAQQPATGNTPVAAASAAESPEAQRMASIQRGKELFTHKWKPHDPQSSGDGLGPMYNAASCADCHKLGGVGGAGPSDNKVELLSIFIRPDDKQKLDPNTLRDCMTHVHPGFVAGTPSVLRTVVLHKFSVHPDYRNWKSGLLAMMAPLRQIDLKPLAQPSQNASGVTGGTPGSANAVERPNFFQSVMGLPVPVEFQLTQRKTPALFGAGLIDSIPDTVILQAADLQKKLGHGVNGQMARTGRRFGKFGWRGQRSTDRPA